MNSSEEREIGRRGGGERKVEGKKKIQRENTLQCEREAAGTHSAKHLRFQP